MLLFVAFLLFCCSSSNTQPFSPNPIADPKAMVFVGNARFTVLTPSIIRCEWAGDKTFNDNATLSVLNRRLPVPPFTSSVAASLFTITTDMLVLTYDTSVGYGFTDDNLKITVLDLNSTWKMSSQPTANLLGTVRTLDNLLGPRSLYCPTASNYEDHCSLGLISIDGWSIIDDTKVFHFENSSQSPRWFVGPPAASSSTCSMNVSSRVDCNPGNAGGKTTCISLGCCYSPIFIEEENIPMEAKSSIDQKPLTPTDRTKVQKSPLPKGTPWCFWPLDPTFRQDFYFLGHGKDYNLALQEFISLSGPIEVLPRYIYGPQYSRWYAYSEEDERSLLIDGFTAHGIPLDVLVLDMDWHYIYSVENNQCDVSVDGWTGYTWNRNLFPDPARFIAWIKNLGLHITNNMHPAKGVQCVEDKWKDFALAMGVDIRSNHSIPYQPASKKYFKNFFDIVLKPLSGENDGIDYWWIDYQQGEKEFFPHVNPTIWVNYAFIESSWWSSNERTLVMSRWGGLGNHRYSPIGFSGDVITAWESLNFQPFFSVTATNVGFVWSHDIGGFEGQPDPELFTRWIQWGAFSSFLRTHCNGKSQFYRELWKYPFPNFLITRDYFLLRSSLVPYIYTNAFFTYQSGVNWLTPLYYSYPSGYSDAYEFSNQYFFGRDMVVSPITARGVSYGTGDNVVIISSKMFWVPPGRWMDWFSGRILIGPQTITKNFTLAEIPILVRAGSIIPTLVPRSIDSPFPSPPLFGSAQQIPQALSFLVFPGLSIGNQTSSWLYDDDGRTKSYQNGNYFMTSISLSVYDNFSLSVVVNPPSQGKGFPEMPTSRSYQIKLIGVAPATEVQANGQSIPYVAANGKIPTINHHTFDFTSLSLVVNLVSPFPVSTTLTIKVSFSQSLSDPLLSSGFPRKLVLLKTVKNLMDSKWSTYTPDNVPLLLQAMETGRNMTIDSFAQQLGTFNQLWTAAQAEVLALSETDIKPALSLLLSMES